MGMLETWTNSNLQQRRGPRQNCGDPQGEARFQHPKPEETQMTWTAPVIVEVCVGMEVTSYESAEI